MNVLKLEEYILSHIDPEPELLKIMTREAHLKLMRPRMLSGHIQGRFLKMIASIMNPLKVLEIGTFTGYSALCLAEGAPEDAEITTIEVDDEMEEFIMKYFLQSEHSHKLRLKIGDAKKIIPQFKSDYFDLIFIDANKRDYPTYYNLIFDKLKEGGVIIVDNTLWYGKIADDKSIKDDQTQGIFQFNEMVGKDERVEKVILPIRDGLTIIRKK